MLWGAHTCPCTVLQPAIGLSLPKGLLSEKHRAPMPWSRPLHAMPDGIGRCYCVCVCMCTCAFVRVVRVCVCLR